MTVPEREEAHKSWTLFFAACDVPIHLIEHPLFLRAVRSICPSYKPPSATCIKNRYINELVVDDTTLLRAELDDEKIWVSADGSENNSKETVIHILATGTFSTRLIEQIYHKPGTKITAERIHQDLIDCREGYFDKYGVDITYGAYLHDNENTEKKVGKLFRESEKRGDGGCGPHGCNKLNNYVFLDDEWDESLKESNVVLTKLGRGKIKGIVDQNIRRSRIEKTLLDDDNDGIFIRKPELLVSKTMII